MSQLGENVRFRKIGEDGVSSFASRMTQWNCARLSRTKLTLSDAWESTIWEDSFGNPWHLVITESR